MKNTIIISLIIIIILLLSYIYLNSISGSALPKLPTPNTSVLDLSGKGLAKIPESVFSQTNITRLDLSNNNLSGAIPGEIRFLKNLTSLDLSDNEMTGLPAELGQLSNLRYLDVSNNKLTGLPMELGNLSKLEEFSISGNQYSQQDLNSIIEKLPSTVRIIK